jgi:hypothetical protein
MELFRSNSIADYEEKLNRALLSVTADESEFLLPNPY